VIWLTWRQFRTQAAVVFGVLAVVAVVLAITGPHLVHLYDTTVKPCASHGDCTVETNTFMRNDRLLQQLGEVVLVAPALIGIFWGAPLVARELESKTFRLVWTQSVSRTRWLALKLGLVGLMSTLAAGLLSLMVTWWSSPFDTVARMNASPFSPSNYDHRDLVPIGYAAFAFALGVTAGVLIRRTLPAMAATLVAFIGVRFAFLTWVLPHLNTPLRATTPFYAQPGVILGSAGYAQGRISSADWVISEQTINGMGQVIGKNGGFGPNGSFGANVSPTTGRLTLSDGQTCPSSIRVSGPARDLGIGPPGRAVTNAIQECVDKLRIREVLTYQPINRYWPFQIYETAIFVGLAVGLAGFCFWWVRRRLI
jgi:hypothetical protein